MQPQSVPEMMNLKIVGLTILVLVICGRLHAQNANNTIAVEESMKEYIKENHIGEIEDMIHQFASSRIFLELLLEKGHDVDPETAEIKRKDIRIGKDLDVYVKHFSEHQNFTMIMVPIDIYSELIYDTLLFTVMEVSDEWLKSKYPYHDISEDNEKERLLSLENHDLLAKHMYEQGRNSQIIGISEVQVQLKEEYISSNTIQMHMSELTKSEKKEFRSSWSLMKKALAHDVNLNIEMNIYIFGTDDMRLFYYSKGQENEYKVTPGNIFTRHVFLED